MADVKRIKELITYYAKKELMLDKSIMQISERIREFHVAEENGTVVACCALSVCWNDLGEIKSLAVDEAQHGKGIGKEIVLTCMNDGKELGIKRVFALTYQRAFFEKLGYEEIDKSEMPQKIWAECVHCHKFPDCNEIAMIMDL